MSLARNPHTVIAFTRHGLPETLARPGLLSGPDVTKLLVRLGVTGSFVARHHAASMFGYPGRQLAVSAGKVGR